MRGRWEGRGRTWNKTPYHGTMGGVKHVVMGVQYTKTMERVRGSCGLVCFPARGSGAPAFCDGSRRAARPPGPWAGRRRSV